MKSLGVVMKIKNIFKTASIVAVLLSASVQAANARKVDSEATDNSESGCAENGKDGESGNPWTNGQNGEKDQNGGRGGDGGNSWLGKGGDGGNGGDVE